MKKRIGIFFIIVSIMCTTLTNSIVYASENSTDVSNQSESGTDKNVNKTDGNNLTIVQKNTLAMLNHVAVLSYQIEEHKNNRLYLDEIYSSIINNIYPNAIDSETENYLSGLLNTIDKYKMLDVKRQRLDFIHEQAQAQAIRNAIPNPVGLLSTVTSGNPIKALASVIYMGVDSVSGYKGAVDSANMEYIQSGWNLDDETQAVMEKNVEDTWRYTVSVTNRFDIPGEYTLSQDNIKKFADVCNESEEGTTSQIQYLEDNKKIYENYPEYWAILAEYYYNRTVHEDINAKPTDKDKKYYKKCLDAIDKYEETQAHIFRKDHTLVRILPMGIVAASHVYSGKTCNDKVQEYITKIKENLVDEDWTVRYFVAQTELDLYRRTKDESLILDAYSLTRQNVNILKEKQKKMNDTYLTDIDDLKVEYDKKKDTKLKVNEAKEYNELIESERKTELPPIYEPLRVNCELLFELANYMDKTEDEKEWDNDILHKDGSALFYVTSIDSHYWYNNEKEVVPNKGEIIFDGKKITIPAKYMTADAKISVSISGSGGKKKFDKWAIDKVDRKKSANIDDFVAVYSCKDIKKYSYNDGDKVEITINPMDGANYQNYSSEYKVTVTIKAKFIKSKKFDLVK